MRVKIKATNIKISTEVEDYAYQKLTYLERFLPEAKNEPDLVIAEIELGKPSKHHKKGDVFYCELNLSIGKRLLRSSNFGRSITEAIDKVQEDIERKVRKEKEKSREGIRRRRKLMRGFKLFKFKK